MTMLLLIAFSQLAVLVMVLAAVTGRRDERAKEPARAAEQHIRTVERQTIAALLNAADGDRGALDDDAWHRESPR